ncbi:MAG TPA: RNA polymerase sigma factor [Ktedonobacteraceae bacterium]|nr:RNA polymerase sigma factor [Ktedonobacteraceae bacterium]
MFYSVAIPGILSPGVERTISEMSLRQENAGGSPSVVSLNDRVLQSQERAHASMTTKKSRDASNIDTTAYSGGARALDFAMLYEKLRRPIHSYIYRLLGSQEDADDLTQEVFTRAYVSWNDLYDRESLSPWLYRIATNLCVDHLRRRKRISWWPLTRRSRSGEYLEHTGEEDAPYLPSDSGGIPDVAERDHIQLALANMPQEYAIVLVLSAAQGLPYQEIAVIVGISPNAAATRISRAKRLFAEEYQRLSVTGSSKQERKL